MIVDSDTMIEHGIADESLTTKMYELHNVIVCEYCDVVHQKTALSKDESAYCLRCGSELEHFDQKLNLNLLPLSLTGIMMFIIANAFPILEMEIQGKTSEVTLLGSLILLNADGASLVAILVLLTTVFSPFMHLLLISYVIYASKKHIHLPYVHLAIHFLQAMVPWGMVEVFMLGILVAFIKLGNMAAIIPGVALWAFVALSILMTMIISFNPKNLWHIDEAKTP